MQLLSRKLHSEKLVTGLTKRYAKSTKAVESSLTYVCVCMIIFRQKDEVAGEVPVAFVVRSNDFELGEEAVKEHIAKQVPMKLLLLNTFLSVTCEKIC